ncbi:MAG: hypothetical protein WCI92_03965 [Bacteroidota bacterium]
MKNKILQLLDDNNEIYLLDLFKIIPEIKGEFAMYMPIKEGYNPNILWADHVSEEFIAVFNELVVFEKKADIRPIDFLILLVDGKPIYSHIPLICKRKLRGKSPCWMPISLIKGESFSYP